MEIIIKVDDSEGQDITPPYHTDFVVTTGWRFLDKKVQKEVIRKLKEEMGDSR